MKLSLLVAILIASNLTLLSQTKLDSLITLGDELSFQFNFKQANKTFEEVITEFPNSSLGYYFLSRNHLWFYLANKDSISKNNYLKFFEIAMVKGELQYEKLPENAVVNYNLGNIYLLKSIYSSTEQNTMDAFWATKSAVNYFEDAIEYDENYFAPYLQLGTIKYALGFVPGFLGWAISVAGLEGEKQEGLRNIRTAFTKCENCKTEAAYHLGKLYTEYNAMYDSAEEILTHLVEVYPYNELFLYQYAILQIDQKDLPKAEEILNRILLGNTVPKFLQTYALCFFLKGEILFKQNKFIEAITEYEQFISKTISPDYTGIANFKIALAYEMLKEKLLAQKHYILARNGNNNIAEDSFADEMSKKLYDVKFSTNDKLMIVAKNNFESGKYSEALITVQKIVSTNNRNE
ncbi:MAG: tetratricopeptide repeat protein, partial [Melioribacteraceae bacterium]|nr:tetratricopeptide repeat protein [Melioribacteraceae bacterium]